MNLASLDVLTILLIYTMNRRELKIEPCNTPQVISKKEESMQLMLTYCSLLVR